MASRYRLDSHDVSRTWRDALFSLIAFGLVAIAGEIRRSYVPDADNAMTWSAIATGLVFAANLINRWIRDTPHDDNVSPAPITPPRDRFGL